MKRKFSILIGTFFLVMNQASIVFAWQGVVVKVIDGDSMKVQRNGQIFEIRLYGIDTPEYRQPYSNKAKQFTNRLAYRQIVTVEEKDVDRYGRIVALVVSQGKMVNRELVNAGLAWYYPRYCHQQPLCAELDKLERKARKEGRGLWRDAKPVSPWEWKRRQKGNRVQGEWYYRLLKWL